MTQSRRATNEDVEKILNGPQLKVVLNQTRNTTPLRSQPSASAASVSRTLLPSKFNESSTAREIGSPRRKRARLNGRLAVAKSGNQMALRNFKDKSRSTKSAEGTKKPVPTSVREESELIPLSTSEDHQPEPASTPKEPQTKSASASATAPTEKAPSRNENQTASSNNVPSRRPDNSELKQKLIDGMSLALTQPQNCLSDLCDAYWMGCVLWDSNISRKMKRNRSSGYEAYTIQGMGKMLSKSVMSGNNLLDWTKPYILLEVVKKKILKDTGNIYLIVAEQTWIKNKNTPLTKRLWTLFLPLDMIELATEIVRLPDIKTTLMIWNYVKIPSQKPLRSGKSVVLGKIWPNLMSNALFRILIYHDEDIHPQRRLHIQNQFRTSELKHLYNPGVFRHFTDGQDISVDDPTKIRLAVYFSAIKQNNLNRKSLYQSQLPSWIRKGMGLPLEIPTEPDVINVLEALDTNGSRTSQLWNERLNRNCPPKEVQNKHGENLTTNPIPSPAIAGPSSRLHPPPIIFITSTFTSRDRPKSSVPLRQTTPVKENSLVNGNDSQAAFLMSQNMEMEVSPDKTPLREISNNEPATTPTPGTQREPSQTYRFTQFINEL